MVDRVGQGKIEAKSSFLVEVFTIDDRVAQVKIEVLNEFLQKTRRNATQPRMSTHGFATRPSLGRFYKDGFAISPSLLLLYLTYTAYKLIRALFSKKKLILAELNTTH